MLAPAGTYNLALAGVENANATGDLDVTGPMGIYGAGKGQSIVDAGDIDRVLHVDPLVSSRVTLGLADIALRDGTVTGDGGGVQAAGSANFFDMDMVSIESNVASGSGGGYRSQTRGRVRRSTVSGNQAGAAGGGISLSGGVDTSFEIRDSTLELNTSLATATAGGGGVHSTARTAIVNSTVHDNRANFHGGGVHFLSTGPPVLRSATVSNNLADLDNDDSGGGGGVHMAGSGAISIQNSVLADNLDNNVAPSPDCFKGGTGILTTSYSHLEAPGAGGCLFAGTGDATGTDPGLQAIADNGGPTRTQRFVAASPLLDSGDPAGCKDRNDVALVFDQRGPGFPRTIDGNEDSSAVCDKGAFERLPTGPPICPAASATTPEDQPLPVTLNCPDPDGDPVTYGNATALHGSVTGTGANRTYTPKQNYNGPDTISFTASDGVEPATNGTVSVTVSAVNDAPVAAGDSQITDEGQTLAVAAPGVLANDSDVEGNPLTAELVGTPAHGTVTLAPDGGFSYAPASGYSGTDSFTYLARDASQASAPATVTITIVGNARPVVSRVRAARRGRALSFRLSEPARATVKVFRERAGVRRRRRCVAPPRGRTAAAQACKRRVLVRSYARPGKAGANTLALRRLKRARYVVVVTAVDASGLRSRPVTRRLRLGR